MTDLLSWRYLTKADRSLREAFTCADPARRLRGVNNRPYHPRPWEIEVQSWLRTHALQPGEQMLLGIDDAGDIGAMVAWTEIDGPDEVLIQAIAFGFARRAALGPERR